MPGQESGLAQALIELAPLKHAPVPVLLQQNSFGNFSLRDMPESRAMGLR